MPDLEPVPGDPFATQLMPVSGDPFASMTHQPDQPAQPYMHPNVPAAASAIAGFAAGGLQGAGVPLPDWAVSNTIQRALQNPDNEAAMGMARPAKAFNVGEFKRLYETGMGLDQIAKELGMTDRTLLEARRRSGLLIGKTTDQKSPGQLTRNEVTKIRDYFDQGLNNQEIADKYGVSKERIFQIRKEWNINPKPRGRPWPSRLEPESPIVQYRSQAQSIEKTLPPAAEGMTRLWRGNRPEELGQNPSFTNDLPGIALPFQKGYEGPLSYIDVPSSDISKYRRTSGAATDAEFILPQDLAAKAKRVDHPSLRQSQSRKRFEPVDFDPFAPKGWSSIE